MTMAGPKKKKIRPARVLLYAAMVLGALFSLVPFFWMLRSSFMDMIEIYIMPPLWWSRNPSWKNYFTVFLADVPFFSYLVNTV